MGVKIIMSFRPICCQDLARAEECAFMVIQDVCFSCLFLGTSSSFRHREAEFSVKSAGLRNQGKVIL